MPQFKPSQLPDKLRLCLLDQTNGRPISGVPVQLVIEVCSTNFGTSAVSAGLLASNHAGYLAFNLSGRKARLFDVVNSVHAVVPIEPELRVDLTEHFTRPSGGSTRAAARGVNDVLPISLPPEVSAVRFAARGLGSIEDPDVADWLLAPGSFGADAVPVIGENGCEMLLPSHAAERIVRFHQIVRTPGTDGRANFQPAPSYTEVATPEKTGWPPELYLRAGELHHYELVWLPINHGLGKVLYSLTLAPCEAVRIAVVDWSRSEQATRGEATALSDDLTHALRRDRTVEEVVNAVLRERQSGDSFMGGMAGVGGYGGGFGGGGMGMPMGGGGGGPAGGSGDGGASGTPAASQGGGQQGGGQQAGQNWGITGSHSLGYAMANSSGDRDVDVETVQNLVDEVAQASHLVRDLRSTVIVQASQAERETVQTRIVRNHNHSHALTVLYYEVVRHYLLRALKRREEPVIFIKYPTLSFDRNQVYKHRHLLRPRLLASHLASHFDALAGAMGAGDDDLEYMNNGRITDFVVTMTASDDTIDNLDRMMLQILSAGRASVLDLRFPAGTVREFTTTTRTLANGDAGLRYRDILQIGLFYSVEGDGDFRERSSIQGLDVRAVISVGGAPRMFDLLQSTTYYKFENTSTFWQTPNRKRDSASVAARDAERERAIDELLDHLQENRHHYSALIWLHESPHTRAARFEHYRLEGAPLIDRIENRPVDVVGDYLVFPIADSPGDKNNRPAEIIAERIVSLPTRGAFAEAKLSHCNASEVIDDTRFWDWQVSPCPDEPTQIAPISIGSRRAATDVAPSSLPAPGVGITTPESAPEPFGLREVMSLLRTPDVFRDMSGIDQLGPLLQKLVEVAGEVEKARIGATTTLATAGRSSEPEGTSSAGTTTSQSMGVPDRRALAQVAQRQLQQLRDSGAITPEQFNDLSFRAAEGAFVPDAGRTSGLFSSDDGGGDLSGLVQHAVQEGRGIDVRQGADALRIEPVQYTESRPAAHRVRAVDIAALIDSDVFFERLSRIAYNDALGTWPEADREWIASHGLEHVSFYEGAHDLQFHSFRRVSSPDTTAIIAFRGSGPRASEAWDWILDFGWDTSSVGHTPFHANFTRIRQEITDLGGLVDVVGHSLGGGIAQLTAIYLPQHVRRVVTFSSPACSTFNMRQLVAYHRTNPAARLPHSVHWAQTNDVVGVAGNYFTPGVRYVVRTEAYWTDPVHAHRARLLHHLDDLRRTDPETFQTVQVHEHAIALPEL